MKVLLSIKPKFAFEIFAGKKKFEYRRRIFKHSVDTVVIYVTSPVSMILGEFDIEDLLFDDLDELWNRTKCESGISEEFFYQYFCEKESGYAIKIGKVTKFEKPLPINETYGIRPPQFFAYV